MALSRTGVLGFVKFITVPTTAISCPRSAPGAAEHRYRDSPENGFIILNLTNNVRLGFSSCEVLNLFYCLPLQLGSYHFREAKGLHQGLKELLKTHNPWDKEVEFSRKK